MITTQAMNQPGAIALFVMLPVFALAGMSYLVLGITKRRPYQAPRANRAARRRWAFRKGNLND